MNDSQYQMAELVRFNRENQEKERAPLAIRKQGKEDFLNCLNNNLHHFLDCCSFLVRGDYGAGAQFAFKALTKRSNRRAWIFNNVGVTEFGTSMKYACDTWHELDTDLQAAINVKLDELIAESDKGEI